MTNQNSNKALTQSHQSAASVAAAAGLLSANSANSINSLLISAMSNLSSAQTSGTPLAVTTTSASQIGQLSAVPMLGNASDATTLPMMGVGGLGGSVANTVGLAPAMGLSTGGNTAAVKLANNTAPIDLILCKLTTPYHIMNDPRFLECGSSACYNCILSMKDNERNLKCTYCNQIHKIPVDASKLVANRSLQAFLKINITHLNQNFTKQFEDSMFALEQRIHNQTVAMDNFDQYLTLVQNDVQTKIEAMKNHLEKYADQFIENLKHLRKEVQKQWTDHSANTANNNTTNGTTANATNQLTATNALQNLNNQNLLHHTHQQPQQQQQQQQQQQHQQQPIHHQQQQQSQHHTNQQQQQQQQQQHQAMQLTKDKTFQIIGIKNETLLPSNLSVLTVLNGNNPLNSTYQLNSFQNPTPSSSSSSTSSSLQAIQSNNQTNANSSTAGSLTQNNANNNNSTETSSSSTVKQRNNNSLINNSNKTTLLQHNDALNTSLDVLQNTFNFSNSSSWHASEEDLDDFDTEMNLKPVQSNSSTANGQKRHLNKEQAQFNKFVREEVSKRFGEDFLLEHEVNQLESSAMELIKSEAIATFLPKDTTPARAWTLAKVSLRSLKRDLRRKQGLTYHKKESPNSKMKQKLNFNYSNHL